MQAQDLPLQTTPRQSLPRRAALALVALLCAGSAIAGERRGAVAFHYGRMSAEQVDWYGRFDILVTHDPLPLQQAATLRARGTRLVLYEWAVGFYGVLAKPGSWEHDMLADPARALLNVEPLHGHLASESADAWYYDPASDDHREGRAVALAKRIRAIGYDGVFLDLTTAVSVHPDAMTEFHRRHPGTSYDVAFRSFLARLRKELHDGLLITNQGYRNPQNYLPYADWDVSESLITTPRDGALRFRTWDDPNDPWNSSAYLFEHLIAPVKKQFPRVRFVHINYLDQVDRESAASIVAIARLFGDEAFVTTRDLEPTGTEISDLYFANLGAPSSARVTKNAGTVSYRRFRRGLVAVNANRSKLRIPRGRKSLVDVVTRERSPATIAVPPLDDGRPGVAILVAP
jgi:hypothetical protein